MTRHPMRGLVTLVFLALGCQPRDDIAELRAELDEVRASQLADRELLAALWQLELADAVALSEAVRAVDDSQSRLEAVMKIALSGRQFSPPELIGMQAGVYKAAQSGCESRVSMHARLQRRVNGLRAILETRGPTGECTPALLALLETEKSDAPDVEKACAELMRFDPMPKRRLKRQEQALKLLER